MALTTQCRPLPGMMIHQDDSRDEWVASQQWDLIVRWTTSPGHTAPVGCASAAISRGSPSPGPLPTGSRPCAGANGSVMRNVPSPGRPQGPPICRATRPAWRSRTADWFPSASAACALPLEGLPPPRTDPPQDQDARYRRIHPAFPVTRPARRLPPHPLWLFANGERSANLQRMRDLLHVAST
jgi:hypothetical protein